MAFLLSVAVVRFPPNWRATDVKPPSPTPEAVTYNSQQNQTIVHAAPAGDVTPNAKLAHTVTAQALANTIQKQPNKGATSQSITAVPASTRTTRAPANAQISLALPNGAESKDPSGLDNALLGRTYRQSISVIGFDVPLPPGQWAELANSSIHLRGASGMAYFLGRIEHKRLVGGVRVFAVRSSDLPGTGFSAANGCTSGNPDLNYLFIESITPFDHQACWLINNFFTPPLQQWADRAIRISSLDRAAAGDLAAKGVSYPQDLVDVRFTRAEKWGLLEVTYLFNPEGDGIASNTALSARESDWHAPNIGRFADKVAYVAKMRDWGESFWPRFQQAFASGKSP
ncbi:hypothetical protein [Burkholderia sp. L27(2015)]|uniref:hypothetical protein n=1 Tax=Burkholderia sp. L27(2015) TaxID=1641858 RepID=UPI00131BB744|nr:hypothetical protein [Burkholderia sp. L27(2015)]